MDRPDTLPDRHEVKVKMEAMEDDACGPESEQRTGGDADRDSMQMELSAAGENIGVRKYPSGNHMEMDLRKEPSEMDLDMGIRREPSEMDLQTNLRKMPTVTVLDVNMRSESSVLDCSMKRKSSAVDRRKGKMSIMSVSSSGTSQQQSSVNLKTNVTKELSQMDLGLRMGKKQSTKNIEMNDRRCSSSVDCDVLGPGRMSIKTEPLETDVDAMRQTTSVECTDPGLGKNQRIMETDPCCQQPVPCFQIKTEPSLCCEEPSAALTEHEPMLQNSVSFKVEQEALDVCDGGEPQQTKLIVKLKRKKKAAAQVSGKNKATKLKLKPGKKCGPVLDNDPGLIVKCEPFDSSYSVLECGQVSCPMETSVEQDDTAEETSRLGIKDSRRNVCSHCKQHFCSRSSLKRHYKRKHSTDSLSFACEDCGARFSRLLHLRTHERKHRGGEKTFPCQECDVIFTRACHLKVHMRKHTGERPFSCEDCGATFRSTSNLNRHRMKHSGLRPYICTVCQANFYQSSHLVSHIRKHTGERPFVCKECQATFTQLTHLHRHMAKHTGKKPYKCSKCGQGFVENCALRKHMKKHIAKPVDLSVSKAGNLRAGRQTAIRLEDLQQQYVLDLQQHHQQQQAS